jgi:hypothetical protein
LIQAQPKVYRLEGAEKLRFTADLTDPGDRVQGIRGMLDQLLGMQ